MAGPTIPRDTNLDAQEALPLLGARLFSLTDGPLGSMATR
jgi:hypothetical protein